MNQKITNKFKNYRLIKSGEKIKKGDFWLGIFDKRIYWDVCIGWKYDQRDEKAANCYTKRLEDF